MAGGFNDGNASTVDGARGLSSETTKGARKDASSVHKSGGRTVGQHVENWKAENMMGEHPAQPSKVLEDKTAKPSENSLSGSPNSVSNGLLIGGAVLVLVFLLS